MQNRKRVAFIKFGGLSAGGTEKWLQMMAANLNKDIFDVYYFYCDTAPYIGSDFVHPSSDENRRIYLNNHGVQLREFEVGAKDVTKPEHPWINSNFWEVFDQRAFDIVITGKAGPAEYPYTEIELPIIEYVTLGMGVDPTPNIRHSVHCSEWQRRRWIGMGGNKTSSSVLPIPYFTQSSSDNLRKELGIPENAFVVGMHQRSEPTIYSDIPLKAFKHFGEATSYFLLMGGSSYYSNQAKKLGIPNFIQISHSSDEARISKFLNTLDLYSHGRSDGETFGTVLAEAMSHGLPIVTHYSRAGANAQSETIGPAGYCVNSVSEYAKALNRFYADKSFLESVSKKAVVFSAANYSLEAVVKKFEELLISTLSENKSNIDSPKYSFGRSPMGFLQYGELNNPASIAHHIVEQSIPEYFDVILASHFLKKSGRFFDVGSNIGLYSLIGAQLNESLDVHCFEPQPDCVMQLQESVYLNNWEDRFTIHNFGLSDTDMEKILWLDGSGSSMDSSFIGNSNSDTLKISTRSLDNLQLDKPDFIKFDIEGYEYWALLGAERVLTESQPVIFLELVHHFHARDYINTNFEKVFDFLLGCNYRIYRSDGNGNLKRSKKTFHPEGVQMYLCVPKSNPRFEIIVLKLKLKRELLRLSILKLIYSARRRVKSLLS